MKSSAKNHRCHPRLREKHKKANSQIEDESEPVNDEIIGLLNRQKAPTKKNISLKRKKNIGNK